MTKTEFIENINKKLANNEFKLFPPLNSKSAKDKSTVNKTPKKKNKDRGIKMNHYRWGLDEIQQYGHHSTNKKNESQRQ